VEIICCDVAEVEIIQKEKLIQFCHKPDINFTFFKTRDRSIFLPTYLTGTYHKNLGFFYVHVHKKIIFRHVHAKNLFA
jgi:hypothetical protein